MKRLALAALLATALGGIWWLQRGERAGPASVEAPPLKVEAREPFPEPDLVPVESNSADPGQARREVEPEAVASGTDDSRATYLAIWHGMGLVSKAPTKTALLDEEALILVSVISRDTGDPIVGEHVVAFPVEDRANGVANHIEESEARPGQSPKTNHEGEARFIVPASKGFEISVGGFFQRDASVTVPALSPGERFPVTIEIPTDVDLHMFAKVVSRAEGNPIPGASVSLNYNTWHASGKTFSGVHRELVADANGLIEIWARSWEVTGGEVTADGYGVMVFGLKQGHEAPEDALLLPLEQSATLRGAVLGPSGAPEPGLRIKLTTGAFHLLPPDSVTPSVLWPVRWGDRGWVEGTETDGRFEFTGLPTNVPLNVEILRDRDTVRKWREPIQLEAGEQREVTWYVGTGATLLGMVIDQDDKPVRHQEMWLVPGSVPHYFDEYEQDVLTKTRSDSDGRFVFKDVPSGEWLVGPAASGEDWEAFPKRAAAPLPTAIVVQEGVPQQDVLVRVHRGLYVRGRVVDPEGNPVADASVHGRLESGQLWAASKDDGDFVLGPLTPGSVSLSVATVFDALGHAPPEPVVVRAGDDDIVLRLRAGVRLSGRVIEGPTGKPCEADVWAISKQLQPFEWQPGLGVGTFKSDGEFDFTGLVPGTYDIIAQTDNGLIGVLRGITPSPGEHAADLEVRVEPGARLRIHVEGGSGAFYYVLAGDTIVLMDGLSPEGPDPVRTVPPGTLLVRLRNPETGEEVEQTVTLEPGEEGEVTFDGE